MFSSLAQFETISAGGVGDAILALVSAILDLGLKTISLGVSFGEGLVVPYKYYSDKTFYLDGEFSTHFYISFTGKLKLPVKISSKKERSLVSGTDPSWSAAALELAGEAADVAAETNFKEAGSTYTAVAADVATATNVEGTSAGKERLLGDILNRVVDITGNYTRAFNFGGSFDAIEETFDAMFSASPNPLTIMDSMSDILSGHSEVITVGGGVALRFAALTGGFLDDLELLNADITFLRLPSKQDGVEGGLYTTFEGNLPLVKHISKFICKGIGGAAKLVGAKCKVGDMNTNAKVGLVVKPLEIQIGMDVPGLEVYCIAALEPDEKLSCDINGKIFQVLKNAGKFVLKKLRNIGGEAIEDVTEFGLDGLK